MFFLKGILKSGENREEVRVYVCSMNTIAKKLNDGGAEKGIMCG
ncbi:hypothetical protein [Neobacillus kokaensis]|nr:hypothetical protein [Neobacillus kokaensis]